MATVRENYEMEIERRQAMNTALRGAEEDTVAAIAQFEELEAGYKGQQDTARTEMEDAYLEDKHYSGKWPAVYDIARVETYPYIKETDDLCNPYFPISIIKAGTEKGIKPIESLPTRTTGGSNARDRTHSPTEDGPRGTASTALAAYPDTTDEPTTKTCQGETPPGSGVDETTCLANGGTWDWFPGDSATDKLTPSLNAWKADIQLIIADVDATSNQTYNNPILASARTSAQYWQDVIDEIDVCLGLLPGDPTPPAQTPAPAGALLTSLTNLIAYADTHVPTFATARSVDLQVTTSDYETAFWGIIKLRLHQVNGSFSKLKAISDQAANNTEIIEDNEQSITDILKLISLL